MNFNYEYFVGFLLVAIVCIFSSCDRQKKYQQERIQKFEKAVAAPEYKAINYGYESLPNTLNKKIIEQRQLFVELLKSYENECLTLIHLYHPTDIDIESVALCIKTEEKNVGIYQNNACVVAIIDHIYQKPMPYYSENGSHWGIQNKCDNQSMLKKIDEPETLTTVNPLTYAQMKINDDNFSMHVVQDRLDLAEAIKNKVKTN